MVALGGTADQPRPLVDRANSPCEQLLSRHSCNAFSGGYSLALSQCHSLSSLASAHPHAVVAERNMHARLRSPCTFPSASSDEQRGGLGLCQPHDASAAIKPVPRHPKKGYAVDVLMLILGITVIIISIGIMNVCNIYMQTGACTHITHTHSLQFGSGTGHGRQYGARSGQVATSSRRGNTEL